MHAFEQGQVGNPVSRAQTLLVQGQQRTVQTVQGVQASQTLLAQVQVHVV